MAPEPTAKKPQFIRSFYKNDDYTCILRSVTFCYRVMHGEKGAKCICKQVSIRVGLNTSCRLIAVETFSFHKPFSKRPILGSPILKEFAVNIFKFDKEKMGKNSLKGKKTLLEKEKLLATSEQFLLSPQCFQKTCILQTLKNKGLFGKGLNFLHVHAPSYDESIVNPFSTRHFKPTSFDDRK